jgi:hypothetical protein
MGIEKTMKNIITSLVIMVFSFNSHSVELDMSKLTVETALSFESKGKYSEALDIWEYLAKTDSKAAVSAGLLHHTGQGTQTDYKKAMEFYLKAFPENGDAINNIGVMYRDGLGVAKNRKVAYLLFLTIHMEGMGTESTIIRANRNLRKEIHELTEKEKNEALCSTLPDLLAYVKNEGKTKLVKNKDIIKIRNLEWWLPDELAHYECSPSDSIFNN